MPFRKWAFIFGLCTGIFILILNSYSPGIAGCAGDCMTCHPKLIGDETHVSMTTCANCHKTSTENDLTLFSSMNNGCGDRCFDCHSNWPKDGYHADLDNCIKCHTNTTQ